MSIKNIFLVVVGSLLLLLGVIGLFLPLLPTTPFVLAASSCFAATPKLHARLMAIPFVNEYICNYQDRKGMSRRTVGVSLVFLWLMLAIAACNVRVPWIIVCLVLVGIAVTVHIIWISQPKRS